MADTDENWLENFSVLGPVDLILSLGDMYALYLNKLKNMNAPIAGVYGNHCRKGYLPEIGAVDLSKGHPAAWTSQLGVTTIGVSGCVKYSSSPVHQWTQDEYRHSISPLPPAEWVVTHCPPAGVNDHDDPAHLGIDALRDYLDIHRPKHLFHGHTYPDTPMTRYGETTVHYVHGWDLIEV